MINPNWEPEFKERLEKHYDELKWLYAEIYNNNEEAFNKLDIEVNVGKITVLAKEEEKKEND